MAFSEILTVYSSRWMSSAAASSSTPSEKSTGDTTLNRIVDDISGLTLLQAADLVSLLKSRLNIQEIAMPAASAAPAAAAPSDEPVAAEAPKEKTVFNVKLESFDAAAKPKIIREVKAMNPTLTLIEAKKFVESLPQTLKENLPKDDAEKMIKTFEALGAVVKLEATEFIESEIVGSFHEGPFPKRRQLFQKRYRTQNEWTSRVKFGDLDSVASRFRPNKTIAVHDWPICISDTFKRGAHAEERA
ncbi:hypothetical protein D9757_000320 [Collybiopsis confluens]|uniref:Uncharacterized protein n=1 Tax=Collybiopsis confluens TaxID=2823264 RepID=A0A8H5MH43_9AGAR|nr:hypothetical protein D9757_000320 [Collybiopsis confluens]